MTPALQTLLNKLEEKSKESSERAECCNSYGCKEKALNYMNWYGEDVPTLLAIIRAQDELLKEMDSVIATAWLGKQIEKINAIAEKALG